MVSLRSEAAEAKQKEAAALAVVEKLREKAERTEILLKKKEEEIGREIVARELIEERFEESRIKVDRLKQNLSMKEEEIKNLTETTGGGSRLGSVGSSTGANHSFSTIHDISVDEKAIEAQQCLLTPGKLSLPIPPGSLVKVRGPSASSTPNKQALGSIAEELMMNLHEFSEKECLQSPFCEKKESQVSAVLDRMLDSIRAAIRGQTETNNRKELMAAVGREVASVKQILEDFLKDLPSVEDYNLLREKRDQLETELNEANLYIEHLKQLKSENNNDEVDEEEEEGDLALEEVAANMSMKVGAVADLLKTANSLILAQTEDTDFSLEPDTTDVSGWQLDLDGIQLVEWQQRLLNYSKKRSSSQGLRSAFPTELSRSPAPGSNTNSLLWQSLHNRLEDLQKASEMSRDLLTLAGDSLRDQSLHQSVRQQAREVSTAQVQTEEYQEEETSTTSNTTTACLTDNCFCQKSLEKPAAKTASRMRTLVRSLFSMVFLLLIFTFFCGLQIDQDTYYPVTWYPLRWVTSPLLFWEFVSLLVFYVSGSCWATLFQIL